MIVIDLKEVVERRMPMGIHTRLHLDGRDLAAAQVVDNEIDLPDAALIEVVQPLVSACAQLLRDGVLERRERLNGARLANLAGTRDQQALLAFGSLPVFEQAFRFPPQHMQPLSYERLPANLQNANLYNGFFAKCKVINSNMPQNVKLSGDTNRTAEGTAITHRRNIYRKLNVHSKQELIDFVASA